MMVGLWGGSKGLKTLYNLMLRIFRHTIAPSAGNDDAIRGGLVNLLYHTHRTFNAGPEADAAPIDVMDFIFEEMYHAILYKKSPPYAPLVLRLINSQEHDSPHGIPPHLTEHTLVTLQQKGHMGPAPRRRYGDDDEDIETERAPSPPRVWRKNASNAPMPTMTQDYVHERVKKASFWERTLCCMNVDIRKQQHPSYQSNLRIEKLLKEIKEQGAEDNEEGEDEYNDEHGAQQSTESNHTLSFGAWNAQHDSLVDWKTFANVTLGFGYQGTSSFRP